MSHLHCSTQVRETWWMQCWHSFSILQFNTLPSHVLLWYWCPVYSWISFPSHHLILNSTIHLPPCSTSINNSHRMPLLAKHQFYDLGEKKERERDSDLEQVNGDWPSEWRLMRVADRLHKSEKWIMIMQASHTSKTNLSWKELQNPDPWLSEGQSIT